PTGDRASAASRSGRARRRPRARDHREAKGAQERVRGHRRVLLRRGGLGGDPHARAFGARRARDHRREQLVRRAGDDGVRRARRVLGRRRGVDRRVLRGERFRATERREQVIEGLERIPLRRAEDERGWFLEIRRESLLPKPTRQTNLSFSRQGVIRGLHYHERGQDDLFACLEGTARVVVLDRESGEAFTEDIGDENPVALYTPGRHAHGL